MILSIVSAVFIITGMALLFDLSPERVTEDLMNFITPKDGIREKARAIRGNKKKHGIYKYLFRIKTALAATGKSKQFSKVCFASLILLAFGAIFSLIINNVFLMPVLSIALALIPFIYINNTLSYYDKATQEELETDLSIITTSYIRNDNIVTAVEENLSYIKPPVREIFKSFVGDATAISSNIKSALYNLKEKIDNEIFKEWVDTLIQCQDDRTLKDTLLPIVTKLTDVRLVNNDLNTRMASVKNEYYLMVAMLIGNIPLLYMLNKDWFHVLIFETPGKVVLGICGAVILITMLLLMKFTKPIEYKG